MFNEKVKKKANSDSSQKNRYLPPQLTYYGKVRDLTQTGSGQSSESRSCDRDCCVDSTKKPCCERRIKENIVRVGSHPLGIGLYLFDYRLEYRERWGNGRQFGVMIDEVEMIMPEAVSVHPDGYKRVDYAMLGISQNLH